MWSYLYDEAASSNIAMSKLGIKHPSFVSMDGSKMRYVYIIAFVLLPA